MTIGDFIGKLVMFLLGFYMIYLYKFKNEKLGNKAKPVLFAGIGLISMALISLLAGM